MNIQLLFSRLRSHARAFIVPPHAVGKAAILLAVAVVLLPIPAWSQILITDFGVPVTQNFDSLGTAAGATLPANWRVDRLQSAAPQPVRTVGTWAGAGNLTTARGGDSQANNAGGGIYNYGAGPATTATDRALGFLSTTNNATGTQSGNLYAYIQNSTGSPFSSISLSYDIEKYRNGANAAGFRFALFHSTDGATWTSAGAGFTTFFAADANSDGFASAPGATVGVSGNLSFASPVANGDAFYLAWNYSVDSGTAVTAAQGLAVDNVALAAVPEPSTWALAICGIAATAAVAMRRRKS